MSRPGDPEIIRELGSLPPGALIRKDELARMFNRCPRSIERAVERGELPPPTKVLGGPVWIAGVILQHIKNDLATAAREQQEQEKKVLQMSPANVREE